jgi:hypothetical protein
MLTSATLAFVVGVKPSHNYWDYLVDPLLGLYCCAALLTLAVRWSYGWRNTLRGSVKDSGSV